MDEFKRLLNIYTGNSPRQYFWKLTGNHKRTARKHLLETLLNEKILSGKEGITRLEEELFSKLNISDGCLAEKRDNLFLALGI